MDYLKKNHLPVLIILILIVSSFFGGSINTDGLLGATDANVTNIGNPWRFNGTGTGTSLNHLGFAACNLIGTNSSQTASTTASYDCAITGVTSSDNVVAQLATTTTRALNGYWSIVGSKASTTSGYVTVLLYNGGAAAVPSVTSVGSSTAVWFFR